MGSSTTDSSKRYCAALFVRLDPCFRHSMRPAWTALCPIQPPDVADAGGDEAAVGAKGETAWVDHAFCRKDEAVCKMRPNDNDIQGYHRYFRTRFLASALVVVPARTAGMGVRVEMREPSAGGIATGGGAAGDMVAV